MSAPLARSGLSSFLTTTPFSRGFAVRRPTYPICQQLRLIVTRLMTNNCRPIHTWRMEVRISWMAHVSKNRRVTTPTRQYTKNRAYIADDIAVPRLSALALTHVNRRPAE